MYNLDMNLSLIIMLVATVVVFFIYFKMKIGSLQDKIKKLQKHLIYFNDMIEKHSETLRSTTATTATTITADPESSTRNTSSLTTIDTSKKSELMQDFDLDLDVDVNEKKEEKQEVIRNDSNTELNTTNANNNNSRNNSSPLTNILPLVSTVMTMMNTTTTNNPAPPSLNHHPMNHSESAYIEDITPELSGGSDKHMLLNEIQEELNELDSSITEQRENPSSTNEQIEIST